MAGFLAGGYVAVAIADMWFATAQVPTWLLYIGGGILFSVLIGFLFDWALIILSALSGALVVVQAVDPVGLAQVAILAVLVAGGVVIQSRVLRKERE